MEKKNKKKGTAYVSALSNPFSTGGGGVDFEYRVQAAFILVLLINGITPLRKLPITSLIFQGKRKGYDIDDVIVKSSSATKSPKLLCQIKRGITIGKNKTFKEVIVSAWSDFNKTDFDENTDRIVLISGINQKADVLRFIYDQANSASSTLDFMDRLNRPYYSNEANRKALNTIRKYLVKANENRDISDEQLWKFCKVFTILVFDLDYESSINEFLIQNLIASNCKIAPGLVWARLFDYAARCDKSATEVTLENIPDDIKEIFENIVLDSQEENMQSDFAADPFWAKLALIGSWNEKNEADREFLGKFFGTDYSEIQKNVQKNSLLPDANVTFSEGVWYVNHRRSIIKKCAKLYFDDLIMNFFDLSGIILKEKDCRIQDNGEWSVLISQNGSFIHSESLRKGIIHGMAMLCNMSGVQLSCSADIINNEARKLIRGLFADSDSTVWMSLEAYLPVIAEIAPSEYLSCLESQVLNSPESMEELFPRKDDDLLFSKQFICSVLWSLEVLAWEEKYFVKCIRILGLLANLNFEKTNISNTPINSIASIMLPWHIQTLASKEKQKNAIKALQQEKPNIAWNVIMKLLPNATRSTGGTHKPRYIISKLPKEIVLSEQDISERYHYYSHLALTIAKDEYSKMSSLLSYFEDMDRDTVVEFLNVIIEKADDWDDPEKYPFWQKLTDQKEWLLHNVTENLNEDLMKLLATAIETVTPSDIRYSYRRLFEAGYYNYEDEEDFRVSQKNKREQQETCISEIYASYGIKDVIEFAKEINKVERVASVLGKQLNEDGINTLMKMCYDSEIDKPFFALIINAYVLSNGYDILRGINFEAYDAKYIAWVLSCIEPSMALFEMVDELLKEQGDLYWNTMKIPRFVFEDETALEYAWQQLVDRKRYAAAINLFSVSAEQCNIAHSELCDVLTQAARTESDDKIDPDAVRNLIEILQQFRSASIEEISNVEFIYLLWLNEYSQVKPLALRFRLANEPAFFCELIQLFYKKKHSEHHEHTLSEPIGKRLFEILFDFCVVPGTDWDGNFNEVVFDKWIADCKAWALKEDREDIVQQTIGRGLSYAKKEKNGLDNEVIMKELNKLDNEQMRFGYRLGIENQRGVHWIDPEGKPEYELAGKYNKMAELAESMGYAKYAETLHSIADDYKREAEENIRGHRMEQEVLKRENEDESE